MASDGAWTFYVEEVGGQQPTNYGTGVEDWAEWHWTLRNEADDITLSGVEVDENPTPVLSGIVAKLNGRAEVTHASPPGGAAVTPCCGRTPFELPHTDRMTLDAALVTCGVAAGPQATPPRFRPNWAIHPGEILQEEIDERGMTQAELAGALGFSAKHVNMLIKGNADIEAPCAVRLERVLGISAELWLNLQQAYDLHHARRVVAVPTDPEDQQQPGKHCTHCSATAEECAADSARGHRCCYVCAGINGMPPRPTGDPEEDSDR